MMKKTSILSMIFVILLATTGCFTKRSISDVQAQSPTYSDDVYEQTSPPVSYQVFYDDLASDGSWIDYPEYGYVWIPRVTGEFHPYATHGHWVMTNYGWTWVSDFRWGWAAFHYGRWAYEPFYGWMWVPGSVWGPAWVAWREDEDYFGWAPLGPFVNISINISCPYDHYRFVPRRYFTHHRVYDYYADRRNNVTIINHTTVINETHIVNKNKYYYGPRKDFVEKAVGQKVKTAKVYDNSKPDADVVDKNRVKVYRPRMENIPAGTTQKPVPRKVVPASELQPVPTDKRLTPSPKREKPQNTEGGQMRPQDKPQRMEDVPQKQPEVIKQPHREDAPQRKPDVAIPPQHENVPQKQPEVIKQPRREDVQPQKPEVVKPPQRENIPQKKIETAKPSRVEKAPQEKPVKTKPKVEQPRKEKTNTQPIKEKTVEPAKKKTRENGN